jgi:cell division septation protein DedD
MSAERKKLLWVSISACVFVLIVLAVGFFLLTPKKGSSQAPATIGNSAPPKAQDPQDFLSAPPPAPSLEQPHSQDGNVIIVYGDKPSLPAAGAPGAAAASPLPGAAASPGAAGSAVPAAAASPLPAAKAPASTPKPAAKPVAAAQKPAAAKPAPIKASEYWIQANSFKSRGRADELKQSLAEKGIAALISVKDISGVSYYRVRIGPYAVKAEADDWVSRLKGFPGCAEAYVSKSAAPKAKR